MTKDNKINIKLEVCRDKNSGKLMLMAHFNSNAPNVFIDKDSYAWMPTIEEHNLINDAFEFLPTNGPTGSLGKNTTSSPEKTEEKPIPEPVMEEPITTPQETSKEEEKQDELPPLEKTEEPAVFEITEEETKPEEINEDTPKMEDEPDKPPKEEKSDDEKEEDEGIIVEAGQDAIERALKKHSDNDKDDSIVEVDEQMIIDKVLSQKKKGKWAKK